MHEIKIRVLHKLYKQVFKKLYSTIVPRLAKTRVNPHKETIQTTSKSHDLRYEMKSTISIRAPISTKISICKLARHHLKESNRDSRCVLCQTLTYATKNSVCTSE
jgi:hypothetical protein